MAISAFLDEDNEGPIPTMYLLMRPLNRFSSSEEGTTSFTALNFSGDHILVHGQIIRLLDVRNFVETLVQEIKCLIQERLFFGLPDVADVEWSPGTVHEEPRNTTLHYSCFRDTRNRFSGHQDDLLRAILTHPKLHGRFHFVDGDGHIVWKAGACYAYMNLYHEVEMMMFVGSQSSGGEPGRGTEIASHLIRNISGGSIRNVVVMFQYFCLMGTYNKTSHLSERDATMVRVPHPEIGRMWMLLISFVRPLIAVWQSAFSGPQAAARARDCLFFGPHRPVTSAELSGSFSYHTDRLMGIKITLALWRHIVTWFLNHHTVQSQGRVTSLHPYLSDSRPSAGLSYCTFVETMRMSGIWHKLVKFGRSTLLDDMDGPKSYLDTDTTPGSVILSDRVDQGLIAMDIAEAIKKKVVPRLFSLYSHARAKDLASFRDATSLNPHRAISTQRQPVTHLLHPSRLRDLRRFLHDEQASFKDPQQALAVELVARRNISFLLISPTGERHCINYIVLLLIIIHDV